MLSTTSATIPVIWYGTGMIADSIINNEPAKAKRQVETMLNRQSNFNLQSMLYRLVLLSSCLVSAMSMSYLGLDMRTPKKCVAVSYPGSNIDIIYEVFGEFCFPGSIIFPPFTFTYRPCF